jgi:hypothetical protein
VAAAAALAASTQAPFANCINFGGFAIFQCQDNAYFNPPPDFDPNIYYVDPNDASAGLKNIAAVFWQIGFGNQTINSGSGSAGTGIGGGLTTFNGNDSGKYTPNIRDGFVAISNPSVPPGSVCLSTNNWANIDPNGNGVDGCCDNPRSTSLLTAADNILNPYYDVYRYRAGEPAYYSLDWQQDYPMAVLLKNVDGSFFALAAVSSLNRGNIGGNGPCNTGSPGANPAACDFRFGFYSFKDVKNGFANPIDPNLTNVVPWQATPAPTISSNTLVDPNDPNNSPHSLDLVWPAPTVYSDLSTRPSTNPGMGGAVCTSPGCSGTHDLTRAPGVGVSDIAGKFGGLVRYILEVADPGDPNFASPVTTFPTSTPSISGLMVPVNDCIRLRTLFGKAPETMTTNANNCRLGKCGDIGYEVDSVRKCIPPDPNAFTCVPTPEVCDGIDNDCNLLVDDGNPGGGAACSTGLQGVCGLGTTTCQSPNLVCLQSFSPSAEVCDGLDNNCNGAVDEGIAPVPTTCGAGVCAATGTATCTGGVIVDSCSPGMAGTEVCDGLDNDCNGVVDDAMGGCTLFLTSPQAADILDCTSPATSQPTISWHQAQYDKFKVFINTVPAFTSTSGVNSGTTLLKTTSWHVPAKKWTNLCKKATNGGALYVKVMGVDVAVPTGNPARKFTSPVVIAVASK